MTETIIADSYVATVVTIGFVNVSTVKAIPSGTAVDDIAIAVTSTDAGATPAGWTVLWDDAPGGNGRKILWKRMVSGDLGTTPFSAYQSATVATYRGASTTEAPVLVDAQAAIDPNTFPAWFASNPGSFIVRTAASASNGDPTPHWAATTGVNQRGVVRNNTFWGTGIADQAADSNGDVVAAPLTGSLEQQRSGTIVLWPAVEITPPVGVRYVGQTAVNGNPTVPGFARVGDIAVVARAGNAGNVVPSGWTQMYTSNQGGNLTQHCYKRLTSGDLTAGALNFGGQYCSMAIYRRAGAATPTVVDTFTTNSFVSVITAAAVSGAGVGSMVVRCIGTASNTNPFCTWQSPATHRSRASSGGGDFWTSAIGDQAADGSGNVAAADCNCSGTSNHGRASLIITA